MKVTVKKKDGCRDLTIHTEFIKLQDAMKLADLVGYGGDAKVVIQEGKVTVNEEVCAMRGKKLYPGDRFEYQGAAFRIRSQA